MSTTRYDSRGQNLEPSCLINTIEPIRDEPEAGHVRSGPADFRPDLSRICRSFFTHFNPLFYDILGFQAWVLVLRQYQG